MKTDSSNFQHSAVFETVKRLIDQVVTVRLHEPIIDDTEIEINARTSYDAGKQKGCWQKEGAY